MARPTNEIPRLRLHKPSGQAFIERHGRRTYLGRRDAPDVLQRYAAAVAELLAAPTTHCAPNQAFTITDLCIFAAEEAPKRYRRSDQTLTSSSEGIRQAFKRLRALFGHLPAEEYGPRQHAAYRESLIRERLKRSTCNKMMTAVRLGFKWASACGLLAPSAWANLGVVERVRANRVDCEQDGRVDCVDDETVARTIAYLSPTVAAMVQLQRLTGARPTEICQMRVRDIDQSSAANWIYKVPMHKTTYRGKTREIHFGPKCQQVLQPFIDRQPDAYVFSPLESATWHRWRRTLARKTPKSCGDTVGTNRKRSPKWKPGDCYDHCAYARAIARAADFADAWAKGGMVVGNDERVVARWNPNQLRHSRLTEIARKDGLLAASAVAGHSSPTITLRAYIEQDNAQLRKLAQ